jgi:hypothetical protein
MREKEFYKSIIICVQVMDEYVDKVYEQFISEGGRAQRTVLKEERAKLKAESAAAAPRYKY